MFVVTELASRTQCNERKPTCLPADCLVLPGGLIGDTTTWLGLDVNTGLTTLAF